MQVWGRDGPLAAPRREEPVRRSAARVESAGFDPDAELFARAAPASASASARPEELGVIHASPLPAPTATGCSNAEEWSAERNAARLRFDAGEADVGAVRDAPPRLPRIADEEESFAELNAVRRDRRAADLFEAQMGAYRAEMAEERGAAERGAEAAWEEPMFAGRRRRPALADPR